MLLAIYQTAILWFDGYADKSIFSLFKKSTIGYNMPYAIDRLIVNLGDNKLVVKTDGIYDEEYMHRLDKMVATALTNGDFGLIETTDAASLLSRRCIIYQYNCSIKGSDISEMFNIPEDIAIQIISCDSILLRPSSDSGILTVIFADSRLKTAATFTLNDKDMTQECYELCGIIKADEENFTYLSTAQNSFTLFSRNLFIPVWQDNTYMFTCAQGYTPLKDFSDIEGNADIFFANPVNKLNIRTGDGYTFSDDNTVVKLQNDVFEYSSYEVKTGSDDFDISYLAAVKLLASDSYIRNEYYLYDYKQNEGGGYSFYFNYKLNAMPVVPSEALKKEKDIESFIEVRTKGGAVNRYKKYVVAFKDSDFKIRAEIDYITAIDKLFMRLYGEGKSESVDSIRLKYCYTPGTEHTNPCWVITVKNIDFTEEVS